jgi:tRNA threonylcarbamoyladenosine dehydratase
MSVKNWKERTALLIEDKGVDILSKSHVLVMGLGGVGGYAAEAIARSGVGKVTIVDGDVVDPTNRNRQIQALASTHGQSKARLMEVRMKDINPDIELIVIEKFLDPGTIQEIVKQPYDYVIDAIDSISPKMYMLQCAQEAGHKIVSSMGAGGKMDPTKVEVKDLTKTDICPFAQLIRKRMRRMKIGKGIKAVFSRELPSRDSIMRTDGSNYKKSAYGTISYLPAVFGLTCASVVIRDLIDWQEIKAHEIGVKKD